MVTQGQFLERPTLIPIGKHVMEGVSHRGSLRPLLLVLPPPPNEGGGMDHVVGAELAFAASAAGFPTLRFNYRGVGASQGLRSNGEALVEDALAALEVAADNAGGQGVFVASINGSDPVALELLRREKQRVWGVCLISPTLSAPAQWPGGVWVVVGEHDNSLLRGAVTSSSARVEVVPAADRTFQRGLPLVGKTVVSCLTEAATSRKH
jgi:alpha/beta superfamily hydrolase